MATKIERVSTGVKGLDKLIDGGIPKGSVVLVTGAPGTGKSILGMQFVDSGMRKGMKCLYVTIEQPPEEIFVQGKQFGFFNILPDTISAEDVRDDFGLGKKPTDALERTKLIVENILKRKPLIVALDSLSSISVDDKDIRRKCILYIIKQLKKICCTTLLIGDSLNGEYPDDITPYLVDGIILLTRASVGEEERRTVTVTKMRRTKTRGGTFNLEIFNKGLVVSS